MAVGQIVRVGGDWGVLTFTEGFRKREELPLEKEARRNWTAVVCRLMNQGRWSEAERIMDRFAS